MMDKKLQAFLFLLFLSGAAFADTFSRSFIVDYQTLPALAYANTNVSVAPSVSPTTITQCTGSTFTPTLSLSTVYVVPSYEGLLGNDVLVGSYASCLIPYTTLSPNQPVNWVTNAQYSSLAGTSWYSSPSAFESIVPGMLQSDERSQYMNPLTGAPFVVNGDNRFKARIGLFCTASVELVSSTNPSIYQLITGQYTGQSLYASPITLPSSPTTVQLAQRVNVTHCIASGRTLLNPSCASYETVWMYHNNTFPLSVSSAPTIITVKNPFACNLQALSFSPMSMNNSTTYSFSLVLKNNGDSVNITSISLAAGSQFTNFAYGAPTLPYVFASGAQTAFSGTVKSPAATGMLPLTLNINSVSTAPNCTGSTANCNLQASFVINVTAPQPPANNSTSVPTSCTLAFAGGHGTNFMAPDSAVVVATCRNSSNAVLPCGFLAWSTTASGGSVSPASTTTPPDQPQTTFSIVAVQAPQSALVKAQQGANFSCSIPLSIVAPDYRPILTINATQVQAGQSFKANVTTQNIGAAANISTYTKMQFRVQTQPFSVAPLGQQGTQNNSFNFGCPSTPGLYELNATVDYTGLLNESDENNNFATMMVNCTAAPPILKPDYISIISAPLNVLVGNPLPINVTTANIGQAPAAIPSTTRLLISGYGSSTSFSFNIPPLGANGGSVTNATANVFCPPTPGDLALLSSADYFGQINESNETNNNDAFTVHCVASGNQPNYVPRITMPLVFFNIPFTANFSTKNTGNAPGLAQSVTHVTFPGTVKDFTVAPLAAGLEQNNTWDFICTTPTALMNETVDFTNVINESDETDNSDTRLAACYAQPTSCNLSFAGPDFPPFGTYDSSLVVATCFAGGVQTACPSFFWQQSAVGGSMSPANTPASMSPNSTLALFNAPTPQIGMKVNATSTLSAIQIYCELPFDISSTPVGPDYVVTSIIPDHATAALGQVVQFTVTVFNQGNVNATNDSTSTAIYSPGCEIITHRDSYFLPHIDAQDSDISVDELACTCRVAGTQNITVTANPAHVQWETNFNNNDGAQSFICQAPFPTITCSYFV